MPYIPHTDQDRTQMWESLGISCMEDLFRDIPLQLRARSFALPSGKSEWEITRYFETLAAKNIHNPVCFLGAGFYDHVIPHAVDAMTGRSEFYTAYTPYQPEASQGSLQAIYEYQTMICRLTEMEVANASLYDGGTALYEAVLMAIRVNGRDTIVMDEGVNPLYRRMLEGYLKPLALKVVCLSLVEGQSPKEEFKKYINEHTAAIVLQKPNFFGVVQNDQDLIEAAHQVGALAISSVYPISLALVKSPGELGVDIVVGEGQSLGIPLSFGGPYLGFLATRKEYARKMPGRIVGLTYDSEGRRGFVLTLQTREQHIRREQATSNICSNEALCALRALVYLSLIGKQGLIHVAELCRDKAQYMKECLARINGIKIALEQETFNEFVVSLPIQAVSLVPKMLKKGIIPGIPLSLYYPSMKQEMLIAVTEKRTKEEIDQYVHTLEELVWKK